MVFELLSPASRIFSSYPRKEKFNQATILIRPEVALGNLIITRKREVQY